MTSNSRIDGQSAVQGRQGTEVDFICKPKYTNTLPDLPFEPKFLQCPFVSLNRFVKYKPTSLEKHYKYELLTEADLNVKIDLIDPMTYAVNAYDKNPINPKDEKLLEDESSTQQNTKRSLQHSRIVPWMRKTEYISTEFNRFGVGAERQEAKIGYGIKKKFGNEQSYKDRSSQIKAINQTFLDVKAPTKKHFSKPGVYAVEEFPVLPDFEMWPYPFAQVIFDADPLPYHKGDRENKLNKLAHAVIRGMMDSENNHFVGYFCPSPSAIEQKLLDDKESKEGGGNGYKEEFPYEHQLEREYNWTVKNKATKGYEQENYFFVVRDKAVYYNELESRVKLVRRSKNQANTKKSILVIHHRPPIAKEQKTMDNRLRQLLYPYENREDEDEVEDEEGGAGEVGEAEMEAEATPNEEQEEVEEDETKTEPKKDTAVAESASTSGEEEEEEAAVIKKRKKSTAEDDEEEEDSSSASGSGSDDDSSSGSNESGEEGKGDAKAEKKASSSSSEEEEGD